MDKSVQMLSDVIVHMKYAKYIPELNRRETWEEICERNMNMHLKRFPKFETEIREVYNDFVIPKKLLPSMRSLQFAGKPIELNPARQYNCSFVTVTEVEAFSEAMFLLLSGCGVGYSVQKNHVKKLPPILGVIKPSGKVRAKRFLVADNIEGWADSIKVLMNSYFKGQKQLEFDFRDIRAKGTRLVTSGGKAPGAGPLRTCLAHITSILENALETRGRGTQLKPIECHDIMCHIADAVLAGGIRRSSCISFFSKDDEEMLYCKSGNWWDLNPQRARANNSAVFLKGVIKKKDFVQFWDIVKNSGSGEPGIFFTNDPDVCSNPCVIGETEILTDQGYQRIDSLVDTEVNIWNGSEWSKVTPRLTGRDQEVITIKFNDGRSITCTEYHEFLIKSPNKTNVVTKMAKVLNIGDILPKFNYPIINGTEKLLKDDEYYTQGFYSGDGVYGHNLIWLYEPKFSVEQHLKATILPSISINQFGTKRKTCKPTFTLLDKYYVPINASIQDKLNWLAGLLDSDGCLLKEGGAQIVSTNEAFLKKVQQLLSLLNVDAKIVFSNKEGFRPLPDGKGGTSEYYCKSSKRICVGASDISHLVTMGLVCHRLNLSANNGFSKARFRKIVEIIKRSEKADVYCFNEPIKHCGVFNGILTKQCAEISLRHMGFCNLNEINASSILDQEDLNARAKAAAILGTIQASYTDFHYLRDGWRENAENECLLGLSMTGIASDVVTKLDLEEAANVAKETNKEWAKKLGINPAKRINTGKPSGSASCVLGTSSGIHAWHNDYYIRRVRVNKDEAIYSYMLKTNPQLVEDELHSPHTTAVISFPQKAPPGAITRKSENALDLLNRVKHIYKNWILPGHNEGANTHNQSVTVYIKDDEWDAVGEWMWANRDCYHGISVLPYDGGTYKQAPFEDITESQYNEMVKKMKPIDLSQVIEYDDNTNLAGEVACAGGACEIVNSY